MPALGKQVGQWPCGSAPLPRLAGDCWREFPRRRNTIDMFLGLFVLPVWIIYASGLIIAGKPDQERHLNLRLSPEAVGFVSLHVSLE